MGNRLWRGMAPSFPLPFWGEGRVRGGRTSTRHVWRGRRDREVVRPPLSPEGEGDSNHVNDGTEDPSAPARGAKGTWTRPTTTNDGTENPSPPARGRGAGERGGQA